jgi:excisionase family DNA binding protein
MEKLLLTVEEAAQLLSLGRTRIYQLIRDGQLRTIKCGKSRRVVADSLRDFIESFAGGA